MIAGQEYGLIPAERRKGGENGQAHNGAPGQPDPKKAKVSSVLPSLHSRSLW